MDLETLHINNIEKRLSNIDNIYSKLKDSRNKDLIDELEFEIYYFRNEVAELYRVYGRNCYKLDKEKTEKFIENRQKYNSDMMTTKAINKEYFQNENGLLDLQKIVIEYFEKKEFAILRLANHINNMRIDDLAEAKRNINL